MRTRAVLALLPLGLSCFLLKAGTVEFAPQDIVFPQVVIGSAQGSSFDVDCRLSNSHPFSVWNGTLQFRDHDLGTPGGISIRVIGPGLDQTFLTRAGIPFLLNLQIPTLGTVHVLMSTQDPELLVEGFLVISHAGSGPQAGISTNAHIVGSLAYNLRSGDGKVIDRIPVPPSRPGFRFLTNIGRAAGLDTGVAAVALGETVVRLSVYLAPGGMAASGIDAPYSTEFTLVGQEAFFPREKLGDLPAGYEGALLEVQVLQGTIAMTALEVASPPLAAGVQIAAKEVQNSACRSADEPACL